MNVENKLLDLLNLEKFGRNRRYRMAARNDGHLGHFGEEISACFED